LRRAADLVLPGPRVARWRVAAGGEERRGGSGLPERPREEPEQRTLALWAGRGAEAPEEGCRGRRRGFPFQEGVGRRRRHPHRRGALMDTYYCPHDLSKFTEMGKNRPELWAKYMEYYSAVFSDGALTEREKALIALGVAHSVQCPYCIDAYT